MTDIDDLRRSDGSIDARMILEGRVETLQDASDPTVSPEMCAELRNVVRGRNVTMIAEDYPVERTVICRHVAGRCSCDVEEPPLTYDPLTRTWTEP